MYGKQAQPRVFELMNDIQLKNLVFNAHGINPDALKAVSPYQCTETVKNWLKGVCAPQQCYTNAMTISTIDKSDTIVGFVILEGKEVIEHCWNRDIKGDFDLTYDLFLSHLGATRCDYFEFIHLSNEQSQDAYYNNKKIDLESLSENKDYENIFTTHCNQQYFNA
jgi:hypothetical protein